MHGIKERKVHNMLWDSVKHIGMYILAGMIADVIVLGILLIYIRMAGPI